MVAINGQDGLGPVGRAAALCVHFSASGAEHCISFADAVPPEEVSRAASARLTVAWSRHPGGTFVGRALLRGEVACDAYLLDHQAHPVTELRTAAQDCDALRSAGLSRHRSHLLARLPQRPLLATVSRAADLSPKLLRRVHGVLLAGALESVPPQ